MKKKQKIQSHALSDAWFVIKLFAKHIPGYLVGSLLNQTAASVLKVFRNTLVVQAVIDAIQSGTNVYSTVIYISVIMGLSLVIGALDLVFGEIFTPVAAQKMRVRLHKELFRKAIAMDLSRYDDPKFYDEYVLTNTHIIDQIWGMFNATKTLFASIVGVTTLITVAFNMDAVGMAIGIASVVVSFILDSWRDKRVHARDVELTTSTRKRNYVTRILSLPDYASELRVHPGFAFRMTEIYDEGVREGLGVVRKHAPPIILYDTLTYYLSTYFLIYGVYCGYLVYKIAVLGELSIGDFVGMYQAVRLLRNQIMFVTYSAVPGIRQNSLHITRFRKFLAEKPSIVDPDYALPKPSEFHSLTIRNVGFSYTVKEQKVLNNICMEIRDKQRIAIVGYNGAGKTTLVKLLMRLYDVTEGEIDMNGENIRHYRVADYRDQFGAIFQDFRLYATTLEKNVAMDIECDADAVRAALEQSGFSERLATMEQGLETHLSKEFDSHGVQLSGGEAQKVAIARVLYRHKNIIIMDEASAALDPMSEYHLNKTVTEAARDSAVVCISHRLSTTVRADCIYMLENGHIVEYGTHNELMQQNGKYAEMFRVQAKQYL